MDIDWDRHLLAPLTQQFGTRINYRPKSSTAYDSVGIYDRAYTQEVEPLDADDPGINTTAPVLGMRDAAFQSPPKQGDLVYVYKESQLFVVKDLQPDSHGGTKLILNKVKSA